MNESKSLDSPSYFEEKSIASPNIFIERGDKSIFWAFFQCLDNFLGVGVYFLPYVLLQVGLIGTGILIIISFLTCYTGILLEKCQRFLSLESYPELVFAAFTSPGARFLIASIVYIHLVLNITIYLTLLKVGVNELFFKSLHVQVPYVEFIAASIITILTLILIYFDLSKLIIEVKQVAKFICLSFLISLLGIKALFYSNELNIKNLKLYNLNINNIIECSCIYMYCFSGHKILPSVFKGMVKSSEYTNVLIFSYCVITICYLYMSIVGSLLFNQLNFLVILNIKPNWLEAVFIYLFSISISLKSVIELNALVDGLIDSIDLKKGISEGRGRGYSIDEEAERIRSQELIISWLLRIFLPFTAAMFIYCFKTEVYKLVCLNGGICGIILSWIIPVVSYKKICESMIISKFEVAFLNFILLLGSCILISVFIYAISSVLV
jgi:vesicular inhibitory amino acid transporter